MADGGSSAVRDALRPPKDDPDLEPQMKHYDVSPEPIGAGGFGTVREGLHLGSNTRIALKILHVAEDYWSKESKEVNELESVARKEEKNIKRLVNHVNVVRCFDHFRTKNDDLAIPMEYCDLDLERFLKKKSNRTHNVLIDLAYQTASGLEALHSNNPPIVHRDIKPTNILLKLKPKRVAKLSDFGLSSILEDGEGSVVYSTMLHLAQIFRSMKTTVGGHGTLPFLGPEFYAAKEGQGLVDGKFRIGPAVDIFALGVSFLYMICYNSSDYGELCNSLVRSLMTLRDGSRAFVLCRITAPDFCHSIARR